MKTHVLVLIIGFTFQSKNILFAQSKDNSLSKLKIGVNANLNWGYRSLTTNGNNQEKAFKEYRDGVELASIGYGFGASLFFDLSKDLTLESGINWSVKGYDGTGAVSPSGNVIGNPNSNGYETRSFFYYNYLDFPLKIIYTFKSSKLNPFVSLGGVFNYFQVANYRTVNSFPDGTITDNTLQDDERNYNPLGVSAMISAGINYRLRDYISIRVEPFFNYGLTSIVNESINEHLYAAGVKLGLIISFSEFPNKN